MHDVGVPVLDQHPAMLEKIPLIGKGRWSPSSTLVVEFLKLLRTRCVAVTGGNILHLKTSG